MNEEASFLDKWAGTLVAVGAVGAVGVAVYALSKNSPASDEDDDDYWSRFFVGENLFGPGMGFVWAELGKDSHRTPAKTENPKASNDIAKVAAIAGVLGATGLVAYKVHDKELGAQKAASGWMQPAAQTGAQFYVQPGEAIPPSPIYR